MALLLRMFPQRFWYKYLYIIPKALFLCNCRGLSSTEGWSWNVILKHLLKGEAWFDRFFLNRSTFSEVSNGYITQTQGVQINCSLPASCIIERQDATPARPSRLGWHLCSILLSNKPDLPIMAGHTRPSLKVSVHHICKPILMTKSPESFSGVVFLPRVAVTPIFCDRLHKQVLLILLSAQELSLKTMTCLYFSLVLVLHE